MGAISRASDSFAAAMTPGVDAAAAQRVFCFRPRAARSAPRFPARSATSRIVAAFDKRRAGKAHFGNRLRLARAHFPVVLPPLLDAARQPDARAAIHRPQAAFFCSRCGTRGTAATARRARKRVRFPRRRPAARAGNRPRAKHSRYFRRACRDSAWRCCRFRALPRTAAEIPPEARDVSGFPCRSSARPASRPRRSLRSRANHPVSRRSEIACGRVFRLRAAPSGRCRPRTAAKLPVRAPAEPSASERLPGTRKS